jgi:hypothetical protein
MRQRRLLWLLGLMVGLSILRVLFPPLADDKVRTVAEAIVRKLPPAAKVAPEAIAASLKMDRLGDDFDKPGNAFAVRKPPSPPRSSTPPPAPPVVAKTEPVPPPPPPPPVVARAAPEPAAPPVPFQVIGTWEDSGAPGVFLSSPNGTVLARPGATLQAEYKVISITPQQVTLMHIASQREIRLAVTRPPATPRTYQ